MGYFVLICIGYCQHLILQKLLKLSKYKLIKKMMLYSTLTTVHTCTKIYVLYSMRILQHCLIIFVNALIQLRVDLRFQKFITEERFSHLRIISKFKLAMCPSVRIYQEQKIHEAYSHMNKKLTSVRTELTFTIPHIICNYAYSY